MEEIKPLFNVALYLVKRARQENKNPVDIAKKFCREQGFSMENTVDFWKKYVLSANKYNNPQYMLKDEIPQEYKNSIEGILSKQL